MPPRPIKPKSIFRGPPYRYHATIFPGQAVCQFHNLLPGALGDPADLVRAQEPFLLIGRVTFPQWWIVTPTFVVGFRQDFVKVIINTTYRPLGNPFFTLQLYHGVDTFGYNQIQSPAGVFAYAGTVTISWTGL